MLHLFVKYSKNSVKYYYNEKYVFYPITMFSLLQSSVSHDPSEINLIYWFTAQETFPIIIITNYYY